MVRHRLVSLLVACSLTLALTSCVSTTSGTNSAKETPRGTGSSSDSSTNDEQFPSIVNVEVSGEPGDLNFAVTMTSPYDTAERYADNMRVRSVDGEQVFGERFLTHDHATEQPFTRSIENVRIPVGVTEVVVEGHDQLSGWGGETQTVEVPQ